MFFYRSPGEPAMKVTLLSSAPQTQGGATKVVVSSQQPSGYAATSNPAYLKPVTITSQPQGGARLVSPSSGVRLGSPSSRLVC